MMETAASKTLRLAHCDFPPCTLFHNPVVQFSLLCITSCACACLCVPTWCSFSNAWVTDTGVAPPWRMLLGSHLQVLQLVASPCDGDECFSEALKVNISADMVQTHTRQNVAGLETQLCDHICSLSLSMSSIQHQDSCNASGFKNHLRHTC